MAWVGIVNPSNGTYTVARMISACSTTQDATGIPGGQLLAQVMPIAIKNRTAVNDTYIERKTNGEDQR